LITPEFGSLRGECLITPQRIQHASAASVTMGVLSLMLSVTIGACTVVATAAGRMACLIARVFITALCFRTGGKVLELDPEVRLQPFGRVDDQARYHEATSGRQQDRHLKAQGLA